MMEQPRLYRAASVGSWGVTSMGTGFDWDEEQIDDGAIRSFIPTSPSPKVLSPAPKLSLSLSSPKLSSPKVVRPPTPPRSTPSTPRPRRRSSQQRVSLIAGRVSIAPLELELSRSAHSTSSSISTAAPDPDESKETFLGTKSIDDFIIEAEIGRGAYGLVKRVHEKTSSESLIMKQVIKSRILADCWKKHPTFGTIPIEIYVMSLISSTSYVLPSKRPWSDDDWVEGQEVKGHPNICPLLDFFEDGHYYYLLLPSTTPSPSLATLSRSPNPALPSHPPSDLFDLVESHPHGLPPALIRSYLGQIADALAFLHAHAIVHRDVKDENVVLGPHGKCVLIDFGSSGIIKGGGRGKGWDTFSGTLDYAGPEILRGERYYGKPQDVWAFGVVAYVLLVGECPFMTAAEAQEGIASPFSSAGISLDERCHPAEDSVHEKEDVGEDGGGALADAGRLVRACLDLEVDKRPTFEMVLESRFLKGGDGW